MAKVEGKSTPLTPEELAAADVTPSVSEDLMDHLTAKTDAEAGLIVRSPQKEHGLEVWRRLAFASEPQGTFSELRDTRLVTRPQRCTKIADLASHLASFEDKLLKLTTRTGTCPLPQKANDGPYWTSSPRPWSPP